MTESSRYPHRLLAGLNRGRVSLELTTLDLCFLAALQLRADQDGLPSFDEELVFDVWDQVSSLVEPVVEYSRKRATHAIQRLRSQRMLVRVDATGIVTAGEYSLTSLGAVIVKSFLEEEELTRESLSLLTGAVIASLARIHAASERARDEAAWRSEVVAPLRVTVSDLVGIERRQRSLDGQQEEAGPDLEELVEEALRGEGAALALVAKLATPRSERGRPWVAVSGEVEIEDWTLERAGKAEA